MIKFIKTIRNYHKLLYLTIKPSKNPREPIDKQNIYLLEVL